MPYNNLYLSLESQAIKTDTLQTINETRTVKAKTAAMIIDGPNRVFRFHL